MGDGGWPRGGMCPMGRPCVRCGHMGDGGACRLYAPPWAGGAGEAHPWDGIYAAIVAHAAAGGGLEWPQSPEDLKGWT